jgi:hypothetical protein
LGGEQRDYAPPCDVIRYVLKWIPCEEILVP